MVKTAQFVNNSKHSDEDLQDLQQSSLIDEKTPAFAAYTKR
jgi:hypothetical protein